MSAASAAAAVPPTVATPGAPWHADRAVVARVLRDLVCAEVAALRPGAAPLPADGWDDTLALGDDGLGLDSLERLDVASAVSALLHLHESGLEDLLLARGRLGQWLDVVQAALRRFDERLTFRTSGSSGTPKPCTHPLAQLQQEIEHTAGRLSGVRRVVAAVPSHHIYGFLFTVLLPRALDIDTVIDVRLATPQALAHTLRDGDLLVSHPAHWALLERHVARWPAGVTGVTSTAPCPDALAEALRERGLQRLVQVYGSSETAGVGWRERAGTPFELMPFWHRDGATGLRRDGTAHSTGLQDRLHWHDERRFEVCGRLDAVVQVGGHNVSLTQVREVLLDHPAVADAAVRLMRADEGSRLKAFVVPRAGADDPALGDTLARWVQPRLPPAARPKAYTVGGALPVDARGKACDWALSMSTAR